MRHRVLIITKLEVVFKALDSEIKCEAEKQEEKPAILLSPKEESVVLSKPTNAPPLPPVVLKPKQEVKSASQIVNEQRGK
jgi:replication factor A1